MKQFLLCTLATLASVFATEDATKAETGCKPCNKPCPERCMEITSIQAAQLLVANLCEVIDEDNLALLQTMVLPRSTFEYRVLTPQGCYDSGVTNYLASMIPFIPQTQCNSQTILSTYIDDNKRVVVFSEGDLTFNGEPITVKSRHTFESVNGGCELKLVDSQIRQVECI